MRAKRLKIANELFEWAEIIMVLLDRMTLAFSLEDVSEEQRQRLVARAHEIEKLFLKIAEMVEIEDEGDLLYQELMGTVDRLRETIEQTHSIIDRLSTA